MKLKRITLCVALAIAPNAFAAGSAMLDEVVVTAPAMEQPLVVTTDPRKPRQPVPAHDGADYLKTIPGFSVIRKGGTDGDPVLRGMAGSRLNILLDGEQILGGCGQRMDPPTAYVFPAAYDKITVLKGPQTVLYGPGNSAGTVLFERGIKRTDQVGTHFDGSLMLGSFGRNDELAEVRTGNEQAYAQANVTRSSMNDYSDGNGQAVHSAYTRWSGNAAVGYTPDDNTKLELTGAKSDGKAAYADRAMDGAKFARDNVGVKFEKKNMGGVVDSIEAQTYYNYVDHVMDNYSLRSFTPSMMMANRSVSNPDRTTTGGRVALGLALGDATTKVGVDFQDNKHTIRSSMNQTMMPYEAMARTQDAQFRNLGVFGEMAHDMGVSGRLIGGLRVDNWHAEDKRTGISFMSLMAPLPKVNPTANQMRDKALTSGFARYETEYDASTAYVGLGHTQRAPDYWELFSNESATTLSAFNTRPEKTTQLDAGWMYSGDAVSGSVSAFYGKVTDYILVQSAVAKAMHMSALGATVTRNVNATTWGMEANAAYRLNESWKLDGSLAYVNGTNDTDGVALGQMPPLEARLGAGYDDGIWSAGTLLRMATAQDRFAVNQGNIVGQDIGRTAGFGVLSVNGAYRASKAVQLSAGVDNLFNKNYAEHISRRGSAVTGFTTTTRINEVGRNLWVKANFKF